MVWYGGPKKTGKQPAIIISPRSRVEAESPGKAKQKREFCMAAKDSSNDSVRPPYSASVHLTCRVQKNAAEWGALLVPKVLLLTWLMDTEKAWQGSMLVQID